MIPFPSSFSILIPQSEEAVRIIVSSLIILHAVQAGTFISKRVSPQEGTFPGLSSIYIDPRELLLYCHRRGVFSLLNPASRRTTFNATDRWGSHSIRDTSHIILILIMHCIKSMHSIVPMNTASERIRTHLMTIHRKSMTDATMERT